MNKRAHFVNGVCLSVGIAIMFEPGLTAETFRRMVELGVPIVIGVLFPDLDTAIGSHRKTFHNLPILGGFILFPLLFNNLHYVWIGVLTHYVLDLLGNVKGMALFYPYPKMYDIPVGVPVNSRFADIVTLAVTGVELLAISVFLSRPVNEVLIKTVIQALTNLA